MGSRMLQTEREGRIVELLTGVKSRSTHDLATLLEVSEATIRRDIADMERRGLLTRVYGGATLTRPRLVEPLFSAKEQEHRAEKESIARVALSLVDDHDVIYLDGGSTVLMFARMLVQKKDLTIITNSMTAASNLMESGHRLILVGGEFRALSRTLVGPLTQHVIQTLTVNKAFMGTIGLTVKEGMTTTDVNEAFTKTQIMQKARQVILLADHSKLGIPSLASSGCIDDIDILVTDDIDDEFREQLAGHGVETRLASS